MNKDLENSNLKKSRSARRKSSPRVISLKFNPLIVLVTLILTSFLLWGVLNRQTSVSQLSLDEFLRGVKENKFSEILIQNDGKVVVNGKKIILYQKKDTETKEFDTSVGTEEGIPFENTTLDNLVNVLVEQDVLAQIRSIINRDSNIVREVILGENFILAVKDGKSPDLYIEGVGEKEFYNLLEEKNVTTSTLNVPISKLRTHAFEVNKDSFNNRMESKQFSDVWAVGNTLIARVNKNFVFTGVIDWSPNIYSFTDFLSSEGITLDTESIEIRSVNVPAGITFNDILTVLTLVGFVVLAFLIFRGAQSSGMGIMQFGQSKAKIYFGIRPDTTFANVAGIDEARDELNEIVEFLKSPNKFRKLGARIPKGVLMVGPPGTGKTLLARAIAGEAGVPFFHTSGSEFEEMLVGAGASRVRDLFAKAKKAAPALIFIDEIDAVARKRGTRIQSGATEQTLNQILVEMDGFEKNVNLIVLAATNRPDVLDPAILRPGRFDRQIRIDLPDMEGRKAILQVHGKNKPFSADVDFEKVAKRTVGFTGADLENILNEAAILAARHDKKEIGMNDIEEAVSKVVLGPAKKSRKRTEKELKLVAYHEAGHAVVAKYTPDATPVDKISIVSRGMSGGVTMFLPEKDEYIISKNKLIADITVSLGGRAAEEIALDDISTGASNDIEKATAVARRMIQKFGMSEKLGLVQYGNFEENEYLGYAYSTTKDYSDKTAQEIDEEVKEIVGRCYEKASSILKENKEKLDKVAMALLEKEVLSKEEFEALFLE